MVRISTGFEGGRIDVRHVGDRSAHVAVPHDVAAPGFRQHFAFDVSASRGQSVEVFIDNAGECTWGDAFGGDYRVYASDGEAWGRADSRLERGRLVVRHTMVTQRLRLAYYPPFPSSRITTLKKLVVAQGTPDDAEPPYAVLGKTPGGRPIEHLRIGTGPKHVWVLAQQHPGESMAGWFIEGLVTALCQSSTASRALRALATVHVVPRMNPDGVAAGNHRTTPRGVDLNRTWASADAPMEVSVVRAAMKASGVSFGLDVHGDERLPWVFGQAADRYDGRPKSIDAQIAKFESAMCAATPDYQTEHKYPHGTSGKPNIAFCSNWIQGTFGCPALTLEMPFSDHRSRPDPRGFFPARARRLGKKALVGLTAALEAAG